MLAGEAGVCLSRGARFGGWARNVKLRFEVEGFVSTCFLMCRIQGVLRIG